MPTSSGADSVSPDDVCNQRFEPACYPNDDPAQWNREQESTNPNRGSSRWGEPAFSARDRDSNQRQNVSEDSKVGLFAGNNNRRCAAGTNGAECSEEASSPQRSQIHEHGRTRRISLTQLLSQRHGREDQFDTCCPCPIHFSTCAVLIFWVIAHSAHKVARYPSRAVTPKSPNPRRAS